MIPGTSTVSQVPVWQSQLARAFTEPGDLLQAVGLGREWLPAAEAAGRLFPLRVPQAFVARMRQGDPHDPLLRQVLPLAEECAATEGYSTDPVGDLDAMVVPGVLHKYHGRVLLTATGACAIHCRYCFRRHFPYSESNPAIDHWNKALSYIGADESVTEVILSGGDPLTLSDPRLRDFVRRLDAIPHVRRLRLHTRLPIVLPDRITSDMLSWLTCSNLSIAMVVHANHANEIDHSVQSALAKVRACGVTLLNQSVLLRGVNDSADTLATLSERLFDTGIMPYYLHLFDKVQHAAHFDVSASVARRLIAELRDRLPGYLVPKLASERPGAPSKILLG